MDTQSNELNWSLGSIVYHVYVRSFMDSNDDGIGDLNGLMSKLEYISSLGCNAIWLSPIYTSPHADFGYDVANYTEIDSDYGDIAVFDELVIKAHERGIRIMMDFVPNHTSRQHTWFNESQKSKDNAKRDWYIWSPGKDSGPPNNWLAVFGGSAWEYDKMTDEYYLHTFDKRQPDLNWRNPEVVDAMLSVFRFWMDRGVDGFRVDVPYHMFKDKDLRDEPPNPNYIPGVHGEYESLLHIHTGWLPESFVMMTEFVNVLKEYKNTFMVSEAWGARDDILKMYKIVGWKYFAPFNFSLITLPWRADLQKQYIDAFDLALGDAYIPCFVLGNHDKPRLASRIGDQQARVAAMLELTLRGIPFIYYGEELGMSDTQIPHDQIRDPFELHSPGLGLGRDPQRTPMQWGSQDFAGFSKHEPWLPTNENYKVLNVSQQEGDASSMLNFYRQLIKLRKFHHALQEGEYIPEPHPAENVLAFKRISKNEKILLLLNFDSKEKNVDMLEQGTVLLSTDNSVIVDSNISLKGYKLKPHEGTMVLLK